MNRRHRDGVGVDVDWAGLDRSAKSIGGEQNLLLLRTKAPFDAATLDDAVPVDDGDGLANGGWFAGPPGWMLFIEGSDAEMHAWVDVLAAKLSDAGVDGILTGARTVGPPAWGRELYRLPGLSALFGYRPDSQPVRPGGWGCGGTDILEKVVDHGIEWLATDGALVQADIDLRADFWASPDTARAILRSQALGNHVSVSRSYHRERQEMRGIVISSPGLVTLTSQSELADRRASVADLRSALISAPLERLSIAMVSHLTWSDYLMTQILGDHMDRRAFKRNAELWQQFAVDPCGIQILTSHHLAKANNLNEWRTSQIDDHHFLVEARDLDPWYLQPRRQTETIDATLLQQARADFGEMILSPGQANALGLTPTSSG